MSFEVEYTRIGGISGPLIFVRGVRGVGLGEIVEIRDGTSLRIGQTLEVDEDRAVVLVFEGTSGLAVGGCGSPSRGGPWRYPSTGPCWAVFLTDRVVPPTAIPRLSPRAGWT